MLCGPFPFVPGSPLYLQNDTGQTLIALSLVGGSYMAGVSAHAEWGEKMDEIQKRLDYDAKYGDDQ